jgi:hypothetical protein
MKFFVQLDSDPCKLMIMDWTVKPYPRSPLGLPVLRLVS